MIEWIIYLRIFCFQRQVNPIKMALESFNLSILPPMYLFAHLYYTDILSLTTVLGLVLYSLKQRHNVATLFGEVPTPRAQ